MKNYKQICDLGQLCNTIHVSSEINQSELLILPCTSRLVESVGTPPMIWLMKKTKERFGAHSELYVRLKTLCFLSMESRCACINSSKLA